MTNDEMKDHLASIDEDMLFADGFEDALIGYAEIWTGNGQEIVALYDKDACIEIMKKRDGMSHDDAIEFFDFNVTGAYVGAKTPAFATMLRE